MILLEQPLLRGHPSAMFTLGPSLIPAVLCLAMAPGFGYFSGSRRRRKDEPWPPGRLKYENDEMRAKREFNPKLGTAKDGPNPGESN